MLDLEKSFMDAVETPEDTERERFTVDSLEKAEWAAKMYALRMKRVEEIKAFAQAKIEKINAWADGEMQPLLQDAQYFQDIIRPFAEEELKRLKKKTKSIKLSNGCRLAFRVAKDKLTPDKVMLLQYLKENGYSQYVKVEEKPNWEEFKKACSVQDGKMVTADGEVLEFVEVEPAGEDTFSIDLKNYEE